MVILGDRYEMRPYMINPRLKGTDWGEIYNLMFQNFNDASKEKYAEAGYFALWEIFRSIRDEIFCKKNAKKESIALLNRLKNPINI